MAASVCNCGRVIEQRPTGRPRTKCLICSPKDDRPSRRRDLTAVPSLPAAESPIVSACRAELAAVGLAESSRGLAALALAEQITTARGASAASLVRQFDASMLALLSAADVEADPIAEIFELARDGSTG